MPRIVLLSLASSGSDPGPWCAKPGPKPWPDAPNPAPGGVPATPGEDEGWGEAGGCPCGHTPTNETGYCWVSCRTSGGVSGSPPSGGTPGAARAAAAVADATARNNTRRAAPAAAAAAAEAVEVAAAAGAGAPEAEGVDVEFGVAGAVPPMPSSPAVGPNRGLNRGLRGAEKGRDVRSALHSVLKARPMMNRSVKSASESQNLA